AERKPRGRRLLSSCAGDHQPHAGRLRPRVHTKVRRPDRQTRSAAGHLSPATRSSSPMAQAMSTSLTTINRPHRALKHRGGAYWEGVLKPVVARYRRKLSRIYLRADAGFANPEVYEYLEGEGIKYAIRLRANRVLQERIGHLLKRPVGRPRNDVRRSYANFTYQAGSWSKPRRVVAKVEWHPVELYPRVGFIVTNMARPAENVVAFYNKRSTCEQWIREGKGAIRWTRLSCRSFAANAVRLQLHALAYNLGPRGSCNKLSLGSYPIRRRTMGQTRQ